MQQPNTLLAILGKMAQKPEVQFDKLFQKLYNIELWLMGYQHIAPKPGNMTEGVDGKTIDGAGLQLITEMIADLKASRYVPKPVRRVYIPKANGRLRPLGIPSFQDKLLQTIVKLILEAIYEPTFSDASHGFRPQRSCHTALEAVKKMPGIRWWKEWLTTYLRDELQLELSAEKTLITHASQRVRFLGYDIVRRKGTRIRRTRTKVGVRTKRTTEYQLALLLPHDKSVSFAKKYGNPQKWHGTHRKPLLRLSELEILMTYNAEIRGFLGYYALADNLKLVAGKILWLTTRSFLRTVANKRQSSLKKVARNLKRGPGRYVIPLSKDGKPVKEYELVSSTRQLKKGKITYHNPDLLPNICMYNSRTELGRRLLAHTCEWCGTQEGQIEVHHTRKLGNLKGKEAWERQMIERHRKTMILCVECHDELHAGKLSESKRLGKTGELTT